MKCGIYVSCAVNWMGLGGGAHSAPFIFGTREYKKVLSGVAIYQVGKWALCLKFDKKFICIISDCAALTFVTYEQNGIKQIHI